MGLPSARVRVIDTIPLEIVLERSYGETTKQKVT
jgi:hypothetical protein